MKYSKLNSDGSTSIKSSSVFCDALGGADPLSLGDYKAFLASCEALVRTEFKPNQGALNNVRGNWYEWLISVGAINFVKNNQKSKHILLPLPNVRSLDYMSLYKKEIYHFIDDLREKTALRNVSLISSNPDYAVVSLPVTSKLPNTTHINTTLIEEVDQFYNNFVGKLDLDDLSAFVSIKTSLRPDRRLQLSHEGALVKAFYEHLKGRLWKINAAGVKYYGLSIDVKDADRKGLQTVATHSILSVNTIPEAAVDSVHKITNGADLQSFLTKILI